MPIQTDQGLVTEMQYNGLNIAEAMMDGEIVWQRDSTLDMSFLNSAVIQPMNVVFAGSSTTQGYAVPKYENYAHTMTARIARHEPNAWATAMKYYDNGIGQGTSNGFNFANVGLGGTTSENYLHGTRRTTALVFGPHLIIHMIGSNDYAQQMNLEVYKANLREVIGSFPAFTRHLLVHSYRRRDRADTGITWAQYGEALKQVSREFDNVGFADVSAEWEGDQVPGTTYLMADNIHATWEGNELLAHTLADHIGLNVNDSQTIWATRATESTSGTMKVTSDSLVQMDAVSPDSGSNVAIYSDGGVPTFNFNASGARYANTSQWDKAATFPMAFFVVINSFGSTGNETPRSPFYSRSVMNDDGWWWVWKESQTQYGAALNSAFSPLATFSTTTPRIVGVYMSANNRARVYVNSAVGVLLPPDQIDQALGPWMKSLRVGANSGLNMYTSIRAREFRFETATIDPSEFMSRRMGELGAQYGISIDSGDVVFPYNSSTSTSHNLTQSVWTPLHSAKVVGSGNGRINLAWDFGSVLFNSNSHLRAIRLLHNGTVIGGWDHGGTKVMATSWQSTAVTDRALQHNDTVVMEGYASSGASGLRKVSSSSMSINPV